MKMKWGALVVDGRNKIGGHVASKNRHGSYLRTKVTPVNAQTTYQTTIRNRMTTISQEWRGLTEAQRAAWNSSVTDFKKTDIFGDIQSPSGFNLYSRLCNNRLILGQTLLTTPPVVDTLDQFSALALTYTVGVPALSLAFTAVAGADNGYKLYATSPQSPGKSFVKSEYRLLSASEETPTSPLNILSAYTARFGSVGSIGDKIFVKIVGCGSVSGVEGTPVATLKVSAT